MHKLDCDPVILCLKDKVCRKLDWVLLVDPLGLIALHQTDPFVLFAFNHDQFDAFDPQAVRKLGKDLNLYGVDLVVLDSVLVKTGSTPHEVRVLNLTLQLLVKAFGHSAIQNLAEPLMSLMVGNSCVILQNGELILEQVLDLVLVFLDGFLFERNAFRNPLVADEVVGDARPSRMLLALRVDWLL